MDMAAAAVKTSSWHRAALVQGTHQLDIVGYGALKAVGRIVTSGSFRVGGRDWAVACRFNDRGLADVSLLELAAAGSAVGSVVKAQASFAVEDPGGGGDINEPSLQIGSTSSVGSSVPVPAAVARAMFFGGIGIGDTTKEEQPLRVDGAMLHYIYTDELPPALLLDDDMEAAGQLLVAADLYDLERLRFMCEKALWDSVVRQAQAAGKHQQAAGRAIWALSLVNGRDKCRRLEELCAGYVAGGGAWEAATASDQYRDLKATCPAALFDVLERLVAEQVDLDVQVRGRAARLAPVHHPRAQQRAAGARPRRVHPVRSGAFEVGGHEWRLLYYPSGYYHHDPDHVAVLLQLQLLPTTTDDAVTIQLSGTLKVGGGGEATTSSLLDFSHGYTAGSTGVLTVAHVQSRLVGPDDTLTIECHFELELNKAITATSKKDEEDQHQQLLLQEEIAAPPPSMPWHLSRLLETGLGSDAEKVSRRKKKASSSSAAGDTTSSSSNNKKNLVLWVEGITAVVFGALLHFVYTDELPPLDHLLAASNVNDDSPAARRTRMAGDLLAAVERYQLLERMRPLCENLLCEVITPETAAATLELPRRHARPDLKVFCLHYMSSPGVLTAVAATQAYKDLPAEALRDIVDHMAAAS
ncbi:unnamed protein product [Urochloa decumbens]|uniref:BPM/SPOP BACK domain-containing protein n=1 Tax=Urochloa decumbens TaxID=240449 RepID=A0ABC8W933_9POAL